MFFKLKKCFTIFKKLFLTETEMQILIEIQIPRDLTWRHTQSAATKTTKTDSKMEKRGWRGGGKETPLTESAYEYRSVFQI